MSIAEAKALLTAIGAADHSENLEVAMDVISKHGSYRNAMIEASKIDFKKREELLFALLGGGDEVDYSNDSERIASLMHTINRTALKESEAKGEDYNRILAAINIRATFNLSDLDAFVMNEIGGRSTIAKVNQYEPNQLARMIENAVRKYKNRIEGGHNALPGHITKLLNR